MDGHSFLKAFSKALPHGVYQTVRFDGIEEESTVSLHGKDVTVYPSPSGHTSGSSKLRVQSVVEYAWEENYTIGRLVATHILGNYVAYAIKATGKTYGMVRVVNRSSEESTLLKGMRGLVRDLSFAHSRDQVMLAVVDEYGALFVFEILESKVDVKLPKPTLTHKLLVGLYRDTVTDSSEYHRVIWCPYIPEVSSTEDGGDEDDSSSTDDVCKLLAVTHDATADMWNIDLILKECGPGPIDASSITSGHLEFNLHEGPVIDGAFSPDGTALATASHDGFVKFFQVFMNNEETSTPKCLHNWNPHGGKPLSCLFFLDNHMEEHSPESQFWKYAITGADHNSEIKLWCCATWKELQTLRFCPRPGERMPQPTRLKAELDLAANYLLFSDIDRKSMYVVTLSDHRSNGTMALNSISEFLLSQPMLSMALLSTRSQEDDHVDVFDEDCVKLDMYYIQPKSLQKCTLAFKPPPPHTPFDNALKIPIEHLLPNGPPLIPSLPNGNSLAYEETLVDLSESSEISNHRAPPPPGANILMTPEAFSSPGRASNETSLNQPAVDPGVDILQKLLDMKTPTEVEEAEANKEKQSAASSPSREVQEILGEEESQQTDRKLEEVSAIEEPDSDPAIIKRLSSEMKKLNVSGSSGFPSPPVPPSSSSAVGHSTLLSEEFIMGAPDLSPKASSSLSIKLKSCPVGEEAVESLTSWPPCPPSKTTTEPVEARVERSSDLTTLIDMLKEQQQQIQKLQTELKHIQDGQAPSDEMVQAISMRIGEMIMNNQEERDALLLEKAFHRYSSDPSIKQKLVADMSPLVQSTISSEVKKSLNPVIHDIKKMCTQLNSVTDKTLTDNITSVVNSKNVVDNLGNACAQVLAPTLNNSYKQAFGTTFINVFEEVSRRLITQLNDSFSKGTTDYLSQVEGELDKQRRGRDHLIGQMGSCRQQMEKLPEDVGSRVDAVLNSFCDRLVKAVASEVSRNQQQLEGRIMSAVRSGAATPLPTHSQPDASQVVNLLAQREYNQAFQQALSASDLRFVEICIQQAKPEVIFKGLQCPLSQPVLLSLLQQLASDLRTSTTLKIDYIEGCMTNLDIGNDAAMKEHAPTILKSLICKLDEFVRINPTSPHVTRMRFLRMAAAGMSH